MQVKTADNKLTKVEGIIKGCNVVIDGVICALNFIVINHEEHDALLGMDWCQKTKVGIFPATKKLVFDNHMQKVSIDYNEYEVVLLTDIVDDDEIVEILDWEFSRKQPFKPISILTPVPVPIDFV